MVIKSIPVTQEAITGCQDFAERREEIARTVAERKSDYLNGRGTAQILAVGEQVAKLQERWAEELRPKGCQLEDAVVTTAGHCAVKCEAILCPLNSTNL